MDGGAYGCYALNPAALRRLQLANPGMLVACYSRDLAKLILQ